MQIYDRKSRRNQNQGQKSRDTIHLNASLKFITNFNNFPFLFHGFLKMFNIIFKHYTF